MPDAPKLSVQDRVAIITGGSRGLGLQIAEALGEMGAKLVLTARKAAVTSPPTSAPTLSASTSTKKARVSFH